MHELGHAVSREVTAWEAKFDASPIELGEISASEAFALYHFDSEALKRLMPEAHAWFESDDDP